VWSDHVGVEDGPLPRLPRAPRREKLAVTSPWPVLVETLQPGAAIGCWWRHQAALAVHGPVRIRNNTPATCLSNPIAPKIVAAPALVNVAQIQTAPTSVTGGAAGVRTVAGGEHQPPHVVPRVGRGTGSTPRACVVVGFGSDGRNQGAGSVSADPQSLAQRLCRDWSQVGGPVLSVLMSRPIQQCLVPR
jgi:hypothetical protein